MTVPGDTRTPGYGQVDREYAIRLATTPPGEDGPVWMVNLMQYREVASYGEGGGSGEGVSGRAADDRYAPTEILAEIGAEVVLFGDVEDQLLGAEPRWDRVGIVRYPTRRSFVEMQQRADFQERHVHKEAGMARTIVMGCQPISDPLADAVAGGYVDWREVAHPPTVDDGPVVVVHVVRYADEGGRDEMVRYQTEAAKVAGPAGARIGGWFEVEGTIVGDGRSWDEVRCNLFPSRAAFMAVAADPARLAVQRAHREPALADTYTLVVRPVLNRLAGVPGDDGGAPA